MDRNTNLIYFNNNRTTQTDAAVVKAMAPYFAQEKNADETAIGQAKLQLAGFLNAAPEEVLFSSGTTESIELVLRGAFDFFRNKGNHIITNVTEHPATLECCQTLETLGAEITYLGVDREGLIDPETLLKAIRPTTILVSIMCANNETGVIQPIEKISEICREHSVFFFSDASQFVGKMRCDVKDLGMHGLAFGAHKMHGPEDIGLLYIDKDYKPFKDFIQTNYSFQPALSKLVGFGKAAELSSELQWEMSSHISKLKNYLEHQLLDIEGLRINGSTRHRLYNTSNLTFSEGEKIMRLANRFDFANNWQKPSHVLKAMGLNEKEIKNSFRFSFGKNNTLDEVKLFVEEILRDYSPPFLNKTE
ncbi:IscS subfamily cysteine desulfurase [Sphingobacteriaceae bacterium]|nr:IscS subfamily cysteine desulfurase [Sphingobacteriaceae bacterium]